MAERLLCMREVLGWIPGVSTFCSFIVLQAEELIVLETTNEEECW
jgi:hypothetical protein